MKAKNAATMALLERATTQYQAGLSDKTREYCNRRGLRDRTIEVSRLGQVTPPVAGHEGYEGRLAIPYLTKTGVVNMRFRCLEHDDCRTVGCPKYLSLPGAGLNLFHTNAFWAADNEIAVCEGELDALTLSYEVGVPGVGVPGVATWESFYERLFYGYEHVFIFGDGDTAGRDFAKELLGRLPNAMTVPVPAGLDLSEWVVRDGWEAVHETLGELRG